MLLIFVNLNLRVMFTTHCCRVCLFKNDNHMKNVEDNWDETLKFGDLFDFLTGAIDKSNLPVYLCNECVEGLIQAYLFKKKCLNTATKFEKINMDAQGLLEIAQQCTDVVKNKQKILDENDCSASYDVWGSLPIIEEDAIKSEENLSSSKDKLEEAITKYNCLKCNITFNSYKGYQMHYRKDHKKKHLCPQCGKLVVRQNLLNHQECHRPSKRHPCSECGKSFTLVENLRKHTRIHTGEHRYECEFCGKKFIHWNSRRGHIMAFHTQEKKYECNLCSKKFAHKSNLLRHVRYHTGIMSHECPHCAKKFNTTCELKNHLVTHTKEKNEICDVCSKAFGTRKALKNHLRIHTGERDYVCSVCNKAFTQAHVLRAHLKTHPNFPAPPPGTILSQKKLKKPPNI